MKNKSRKKIKKITDRDFQKFRIMYPCENKSEIKTWLKSNMQPLEYIQGRLIKIGLLVYSKEDKNYKGCNYGSDIRLVPKNNKHNVTIELLNICFDEEIDIMHPLKKKDENKEYRAEDNAISWYLLEKHKLIDYLVLQALYCGYLRKDNGYIVGDLW